MQALRISELAARSGFTAPTLRYYERIGVLPPPSRTDAGYRVYNERTVELLRFVGRAKSLGLTLDETRELAGLWSRDKCEPVQARLGELLHDKMTAARDQIDELQAFLEQLESVASMLGHHVPDGPCDDECGCTSAAVPITFKRLIDVEDDTPIACTLGAADIGPRLDAWRSLLAHKRDLRSIDDGMRVEFDDTVEAAEVAALAQDEQSCCAFLSFAVVVDRDGVALEVRGSSDARPVIDALVGLQSS